MDADKTWDVNISTGREWALLLILAGIQFTHILDFMIMMPLGPQLTQAFAISDAKFGLLVSAYTFAAGTSGLLASLYIDRFERRRLLLILYFLFALATLACGLAPTYETLMGARVAAGLFGGILSAMIQTIVADVVPFARRGKAMGIIMTSFSVSTVMGVPLGLFVAANSNWHTPFLALQASASCCWSRPCMLFRPCRATCMHGVKQVRCRALPRCCATPTTCLHSASRFA